MHVYNQDNEGSPIDRAIRQAMDDGKFDNLSGRGKPFPREDENPWEDEGSWAAHRLLKSAGFSTASQLDERFRVIGFVRAVKPTA